MWYRYICTGISSIVGTFKRWRWHPTSNRSVLSLLSTATDTHLLSCHRHQKHATIPHTKVNPWLFALHACQLYYVCAHNRLHTRLAIVVGITSQYSIVELRLRLHHHSIIPLWSSRRSPLAQSTGMCCGDMKGMKLSSLSLLTSVRHRYRLQGSERERERGRGTCDLASFCVERASLWTSTPGAAGTKHSRNRWPHVHFSSSQVWLIL